MTTQNNKVRLATVWFGGCAGCHMSFLDIDERLIDVVGLVDIVYSPVADIKKFPDNVDVTLVEGAVCNSDHIREAKEIREQEQGRNQLWRLCSHRERSQYAKSPGCEEYHFGSLLGGPRRCTSGPGLFWMSCRCFWIKSFRCIRSSRWISICRGVLLIRKGFGRRSPCCSRASLWCLPPEMRSFG